MFLHKKSLILHVVSFVIIIISIINCESQVSYGHMHPRALQWDVVHDTMEDVVARPNTGTMLENARAWITGSRMTVGGGGLSDRHVDLVILYFL